MTRLRPQKFKRSIAPSLKATTSMVALIGAVGFANMAQAQTLTITQDPAVLNNFATIDAGSTINTAGNLVLIDGPGVVVVGEADGTTLDITNSGLIQGRGQAGAGAIAAGDGIRFERDRVAGVLDATTTGLFTGSIVNSGTIASESNQGTAAGIRFVNGTSFQGTLDNSGTISGVRNGLYFGNPTPAGGGVNSGTVNNLAGGTISSDSRAVNIDGSGLTLNNAGSILGTGNQRNGTVYADGTANDYAINNLAGGLIDAGAGNQGSGISLQSGSADGDVRNISITNAGNIVGRGAALPSGQTAGLRIFNGAGAGTVVTVNGDITNTGTISSETSAAVLIENVAFTGTFTNSGTLSAPQAFDASSALGTVNFVQNGGSIAGDFVGSSALDTLTFASGATTLAGSVLGNVDTNVLDAAILTIGGNQNIAGNFVSDGTLNFVLGEDSLAVDGNTTFGNASLVNVETPDDITTLTLGAPISVISETGTFTDNGLTVNVDDDDFLVDYSVILGSVTVTPTAVNLANVSTDANISAFGGALTTAFVAGALQADVANALNDVTNATEFDSVAAAFLPTTNEGITREVFETNSQANSYIDRRLQGEGVGAWVQAQYRTADRDAESTSVSGYDADAFGFTLGLDTKLSQTLTAGVAFNYASIDVDEDGGANDRTEIDSYQITAYAGLNNNDFFANAQIGYTFADVDSQRTSNTGSIVSSSDLDGFSALATVGKEYVNGGISLTPLASIHFANLSQDDFSEVGGLNFDIDADGVSYLDLKAGFELSTAQNNNGGLNVRPLVRASYAYDAIGDARILNASFAGAGAPIVLSSGDPAQSRFELGAGLQATNGAGFTFSIEYDGEFASGYSSHGGFLRARIGF